MLFPPNQMIFYLPSDRGLATNGEPYTYEQFADAARYVAWHFSLGDPSKFHPPGDMMQSVLDAMARADRANFGRLARAFPLHAAMMRIVLDDDVAGLSMIMNLLDYNPSAWDVKQADKAVERLEAALPVEDIEPNQLPALCEHGITEVGACKNADCPNCIDNLIRDLGPLPLPPQYGPNRDLARTPLPEPYTWVDAIKLHPDGGGSVIVHFDETGQPCTGHIETDPT